MKYIKLKDDQFDFNGVDHTRNVVRAITINQDNKIALHHIFNTDIFGERDYYETPGGGVNNNEELLEALKRELYEELGATNISVIQEICIVEDYYNLIKRKNINHYYLVSCSSFEDKQLTEDEKRLIESTIWVNIDEAINLYKNTKRTKISNLVINRELPVLIEAKSLMAQLFYK
ncbi:MAG: NUDIX domain-containing protein [Bacilli bacterium]